MDAAMALSDRRELLDVMDLSAQRRHMEQFYSSRRSACRGLPHGQPPVIIFDVVCLALLCLDGT